MKKDSDFTIKIEGTIEIDVPDHLINILENSYRLNQYIFPSEGDELKEYKEELFDLINNSIDLNSCYFNEIEIDNVNNVEYEN